MTFAEFLLSIVGVALVVLQSVNVAIALETRDIARALLARDSVRRQWVREEHDAE